MTLSQILAAWFLASILAGLALGRIMRGPTAPMHLQPPQHAAGSDSERDGGAQQHRKASK